MVEPICSFCGLRVYDSAPGQTMHPCCVHAKARGETRCGGCEDFKRRMGLVPGSRVNRAHAR